jgi:hypothetical protein
LGSTSWFGSGYRKVDRTLTAYFLCEEGEDREERRERGAVLDFGQQPVSLTAAASKRAETFVITLCITVLQLALRLDENLHCTLHDQAEPIFFL